MSAILLTHLGPSTPVYLSDCVHQIRLWNPDLPVFLILDACHRANPFYTSLAVEKVYTDELEPTEHHKAFNLLLNPKDLGFRNGYWKHVKERFYFMEELMLQKNLSYVLSMEYDILLYLPVKELVAAFTTKSTLRFVMDNDTRGHPGFMYIPDVSTFKKLNVFMTNTLLLPKQLSDMEVLAMYALIFPDRVNFLPCITEQRNRSIASRKSLTGYSITDAILKARKKIGGPQEEIDSRFPWCLSEDSELFGCLFDSAVVGQFLGGIDARNSGGSNSYIGYCNESALYNVREMSLGWAKFNEKWIPILDGRPLATIHVHSKALKNFLSDRSDMPKGDYSIEEILKTLEPN